MQIITFILNLIATAIIYMLPTLIILAIHGSFEKKRNAVIVTAVIALLGYAITWFIAFSPIGSGQVPKGFATVAYSFANYELLYIKKRRPDSNPVSCATDIEPEECSDNLTVATQTAPATPTIVDETMKEYADIMLPAADIDQDIIDKKKSSKKLTITLTSVIAVLLIAVGVTGTAYIHLSQELNTEKEANEKLVRQLEEKTTLANKYEPMAKFFYDNAVFANDDDGYYHYYDCPIFGYSSYYIFNVENAEALGYKPCISCSDIDHRMDVLY